MKILKLTSKWLINQKDDLLHSIKKAHFRITRLIDFIKLGWNDYDWDYGFTYTLLHYKFKKQAEYFAKSGIAQDHKHTAKACRVLYKSLSKFEQYDNDYFNKYMEKKLPFKYDMSFGKVNHSTELSSVIWVYEGTNTPLSEADTALKLKIVGRAMRYEQRMIAKYRKIFYKTMDKYMERFWD